MSLFKNSAAPTSLKAPVGEDVIGSDKTPAWRIVAAREIKIKLTNRTYLLSLLFVLGVIGASFGAQAYMANKTTEYQIAATSDAQGVAKQVAAELDQTSDKVKTTIVTVDSADAAKAALKDEKATVWLSQNEGAWTLTAQESVPPAINTAASTVISSKVLAANAQKAGTTLEKLSAGSQVKTVSLDPEGSEADGVKRASGVILAILFFMSCMLYGNMLAASVVEEKQSRIVEIISTSISTRSLLAGKVLGNLALALMQTALMVGVGLIGLQFSPFKSYLGNITTGVGWFLAFFIAGFVLVAALYAVAGALASRSEDVQSTSQPVTMLMIATYIGGLSATGVWAQWLSYIPPVSAVLMPGQVISGQASWWQALIALALLMLAAFVVVTVAARLYDRALLQTSGKISYRQAWTAQK